MAFDYADTFVATCGRAFSSSGAGRDHQDHCPDCQAESDSTGLRVRSNARSQMEFEPLVTTFRDAACHLIATLGIYGIASSWSTTPTGGVEIAADESRHREARLIAAGFVAGLRVNSENLGG